MQGPQRIGPIVKRPSTIIVGNNIERFQIVLNIVVWCIVGVDEWTHLQTVLINGRDEPMQIIDVIIQPCTLEHPCDRTLAL